MLIYVYCQKSNKRYFEHHSTYFPFIYLQKLEINSFLITILYMNGIYHLFMCKHSSLEQYKKKKILCTSSLSFLAFNAVIVLNF